MRLPRCLAASAGVAKFGLAAHSRCQRPWSLYFWGRPGTIGEWGVQPHQHDEHDDGVLALKMFIFSRLEQQPQAYWLGLGPPPPTQH